MLFESHVVDAVCAELQARGYRICQRLQTHQKGDDIAAVKQGSATWRLYVEAKGGTSSRIGSKRYGKPFSGAQIRVHIAEALYKAATVLSKRREDAEVRAGIALPYTEQHRACVKSIQSVLRDLGIAVFWVQQDGDVQIVSPWEV